MQQRWLAAQAQKPAVYRHQALHLMPELRVRTLVLAFWASRKP